jgi:hypothetical protein
MKDLTFFLKKNDIPVSKLTPDFPFKNSQKPLAIVEFIFVITYFLLWSVYQSNLAVIKL